MNELELLTALRDTDAEPPRPEVRAAARRALVEEASRRRRRPRPRRSWLVGAAAAATAAGVAVALTTGVDSGRLAPPKARAALARAAQAAQLQPGRDLRPGEFLYLRERDAYMTTVGDEPPYTAITPTERESWIGRDGAGRFVDRATGRTEFPGPRDRARWIADGRPDLGGDGGPQPPDRIAAEGFSAGSQMLGYDELAALPSDGREMYDKLIELAGDAGPSPDAEAFTIIGDLLRAAPVPARVRAGLYRAAAYIKGIRFAGEVVDPLGRHGLAVELSNPEGRSRLVFDPQTSELLAEESVLGRRVNYIDADPGFVTGSRVVVQASVVTSDTARPARR